MQGKVDWQRKSRWSVQNDYISGLIGGADPGLGVGSIDPVLALEIAHTYSAAFFHRYLNGDESSSLFTESPWSEAEISLWE